MANVMSMKSVKNRPHRDGFDLSKRNLFTAKIGELIPVYCKEVLPGDSFKINQKWFTRTRPVNTAAYTRFREYYDWFFVPTNLLWNKFNTFISQTAENPFHASSIYNAQYTGDTHPYTSVFDVHNALATLNSDENYSVNFFEFERAALSRKLLHNLGYGDFKYYEPGSLALIYNEDAALNPFPLLAYQKIYQDYYRNSQWEKSAPWTCNVDYMFMNAPYQNASMKLDFSSLDFSENTLFDLRYANWHKDYFMGVMPNSQFGDAASVDLSSLLNPVNSESFVLYNNSSTSGNAQFVASQSLPGASALLNEGSNNNANMFLASQGVEKIAKSIGLTADKLSSTLTILALRQAEAMQKWKEVTQANAQDYKAQVEAHFGVQLSDAYSERCKFIDGVVNNVDISEVVNTNLADLSVEANIAGKGSAAGQGYINFDSKVHGYLMCIYHCVPLLDYSLDGIKRECLKTNVIDYAIPEFDQTGMIQVPTIEISNKARARLDSKIKLLGYAPRYVDYKTDYDEVHGAFYNGSESDQAWVAPLDRQYFWDYLNALPTNSTSIDYRFFKIPPSVVNNIFGVDADDSTSTDHMLVNCGFDIKAVRDLDYNGLPY